MREQKDFWNGGNYVLRKATRKQKKMLKGMILLLIAPLVFTWAVKIMKDNQ